MTKTREYNAKIIQSALSNFNNENGAFHIVINDSKSNRTALRAIYIPLDEEDSKDNESIKNKIKKAHEEVLLYVRNPNELYKYSVSDANPEIKGKVIFIDPFSSYHTIDFRSWFDECKVVSLCVEKDLFYFDFGPIKTNYDSEYWIKKTKDEEYRKYLKNISSGDSQASLSNVKDGEEFITWSYIARKFIRLYADDNIGLYAKICDLEDRIETLESYELSDIWSRLRELEYKME